MEWLKAIRVQHGLSQGDVAKQANISQPSYTNIENGKRRPAVQTAKRIATILGFDWTKFYEEDTAANLAEAEEAG